MRINRMQNSSAHLWMLLALLCTMFVMTGCVNTQWAYSEAKTVEERAYVVLEHYSSLVKEAADLAEKPNTSPEAIKAMKKADAAAMPVIQHLRDLRNAWLASQSAENTKALQVAVDDAIATATDMRRALEQARGETP